MTNESRSQQILKMKFEEAKTRNPRLSLRGFAQRLEMSSGALSEVLQGKRILTAKAKKKVAERLQLSPKEQMEFFGEELPPNLRGARKELLLLSSDQFHLISDWWHFGLLNLINTRNFKPQVPWLARRLGLTVNVVHEAWDRLLRLGYIKKENGKILRGSPSIETTDDFFDLSIQKSHLSDLKLIENSILETPLAERDHVSMTFAMNRKDLPRAKELLRLFQDQFEAEIEKNPGDEVYRLSFSLYPLTKINGEKNEN